MGKSLWNNETNGGKCLLDLSNFHNIIQEKTLGDTRYKESMHIALLRKIRAAGK